jgi:hypothetical protein
MEQTITDNEQVPEFIGIFAFPGCSVNRPGRKINILVARQRPGQ